MQIYTMIDSAYILVVVILICIFLFYIFTLYSSDNELPPPSATPHKYIKTKDHIISIPHDVLDAMLSRYRNMLIRHCNSGFKIDATQLQKIQKSLAAHVKTKYGVVYKLFPDELEIYILNLGVRQSNQYDAELVGGVDLPDSAKSLGIIIWYLERIALNNKSQSNTVEVPLILEDLDSLLDKQHKEEPRPPEMPEGMPVELPAPKMDSYGMTDVPDKFVQARKKVGNSPKECSTALRSDLHNFISDSAAQAMHHESMGAGDVYSKSQNAREAKSSWRHINHSRLADTSHDRDHEFGESDNRDQGPYLSYANYNLSMGLMHQDYTNRNGNQKQEIGDDWTHIEEQLFA